MAYRVHVEQDGRPWRVSERSLPSAPAPVPHRGYPVVCVRFGDTLPRFSSQEQLA